MKQFIQRLALSLGSFVLGFTLIFGGSQLAGCKKTLEAGGAYSGSVLETNLAGGVVTNQVAAPDLAFYTTDLAFSSVDSLIDGVFNWERANRAFLWGRSPDIKRGLDKIRPTAWEIRKQYVLARETYKANPTPAGLDTLGTLLAKLQQLQTTATALSSNLNTQTK